jgi:hypothetical protein
VLVLSWCVAAHGAMPSTIYSPEKRPAAAIDHHDEPDLQARSYPMPKAARNNSTPRRSASSRKTSPAQPTPRPIVDDPIFAAIDNHRKLDRAWLDLEAASERAGRGDDVRKYHVDRASDAAEKAAWKMAQTKPSTAAGASALLTYITTGPITGLFELGETHWHETAFRNVAASLAKITHRSQQAA